jgi:hypothetical protein
VGPDCSTTASGISGNLDEILAQLHRIQNPDLRPLAEQVAEVIVEGNRDGLLAGTDATGAPMAELADSTYRATGMARRGGLGPPTVPRFSASSLIDRFKVSVDTNSSGKGFVIKAGWIGVEQVKFFASGTKYMPARNPVGIRPETRVKIQTVVDNFAKNLVVKP